MSCARPFVSLMYNPLHSLLNCSRAGGAQGCGACLFHLRFPDTPAMWGMIIMHRFVVVFISPCCSVSCCYSDKGFVWVTALCKILSRRVRSPSTSPPSLWAHFDLLVSGSDSLCGENQTVNIDLCLWVYLILGCWGFCHPQWSLHRPRGPVYILWASLVDLMLLSMLFECFQFLCSDFDSGVLHLLKDRSVFSSALYVFHLVIGHYLTHKSSHVLHCLYSTVSTGPHIYIHI